MCGLGQWLARGLISLSEWFDSTTRFQTQEIDVNCYPARGAQGILIRTVTDDVVLRIYNSDGDFVDFDIAHSDLAVTVTDLDAYFYQHADGRLCLDHAPNTLGLDKY